MAKACHLKSCNWQLLDAHLICGHQVFGPYHPIQTSKQLAPDHCRGVSLKSPLASQLNRFHCGLHARGTPRYNSRYLLTKIP